MTASVRGGVFVGPAPVFASCVGGSHGFSVGRSGSRALHRGFQLVTRSLSVAALCSRTAGPAPQAPPGRPTASPLRLTDVAFELVLDRMVSCGWPVGTTCNLAWPERGTRGVR